MNRAGWVLVGGRSCRMGTNKALLEMDGQPLFRRVAEEIGKICGTVSLVGDPIVYGGLGLPVIPDRFPGLGPLAGIEAALNATNAEWNLLVACDMPSLDASILEELFVASEGTDGAVPSYGDGRIEQLSAVLHARCHAAIWHALETGVLRSATPSVIYSATIRSSEQSRFIRQSEHSGRPMKRYGEKRDG